MVVGLVRVVVNEDVAVVDDDVVEVVVGVVNDDVVVIDENVVEVDELVVVVDADERVDVVVVVGG